MKKSTLIIIVIILMLVAIVIFASTGIRNTENNSVSGKETKTNNEVENTEMKNEQNIIENIIENTTENENIVENVVTTETFEESPKTAKEKALDIVKKDWGEGANIEFTVDGIEGNNYIVTVRNSQTTEALAFYTVNTNDGTFTKREMN